MAPGPAWKRVSALSGRHRSCDFYLTSVHPYVVYLVFVVTDKAYLPTCPKEEPGCAPGESEFTTTSFMGLTCKQDFSSCFLLDATDHRPSGNSCLACPKGCTACLGSTLICEAHRCIACAEGLVHTPAVPGLRTGRCLRRLQSRAINTAQGRSRAPCAHSLLLILHSSLSQLPFQGLRKHVHHMSRGAAMQTSGEPAGMFTSGTITHSPLFRGAPT